MAAVRIQGLLFAAIAAMAVIVSGCDIGKLDSESIGLGRVLGESHVTLAFSINETGEVVDGKVFLNGQALGNTSNGTVTIAKKALVPGTLIFLGNDKTSGSSFEFRFEFLSYDVGFDMINLEIPLKEYKTAVFDASSLDAEKIEQKIFGLANEERKKAGIKALRWNERIAEVARSYAEALPIEGFHHTDSAGNDVKKRLSSRGVIFVVANENLFFSSSITEETDLSRAAVDGWLGSPGHRATLLDRDGLYSDAGVGMHCERKECYVVMNFAATRQEQKLSLNKGWVTFQYLHNPAYNFAQDAITVDFELSSTSPVNVYVVQDYSAYKDFVENSRNEPSGYLSRFEGTVFINERFNAGRGSGVIIESPTGDSNIQFLLEFS
ncbi:hypothetical protein HYU17_01840 [Candidatus Woesearchaeota archaeon]|nr:hypothetical protein [Candidatus Woesearchaeota archaeon]